MQFDKQTGKELEFDVVCEILSSYCKSNKAKDNAKKLSFFDNLTLLQNELDLQREVQIILHDNSINMPHPNYEDIDNAMKILRIENGVLIIDELLKVFTLCIGTKRLIDFANRYKNQFKLIYQSCSHIERVNEVLAIIQDVLNEKSQIKDDATPTLYKIRTQISSNRKEINKNFERVLRKYKKDEIIGDIEEAFLENRRLLSVLSQHKRRVAGKVYGTSNRGNYTYIEPAENQELNKKQDQLKIDESNEVFQILKTVSAKLRSEKSYLEAFQRLLVRFDLLNAKVLFAESYQGIIPRISEDKGMYWQNAKHPLLLIKNNQAKIDTIGQTFELNEDGRFLVISGPNAGGKSITLKTVGLLQMMFQSGLFLPLDDVSSCGWFEQIFSDIGDNQSIENQLSTYSYRLKRMHFFLENANKNTLLLLDEFGSGSDPELGGALAEVFYEELYKKNCFAVVTTHYTNIKILTSSLPEAMNACMLFDTKKLAPLYQLSIGQPGSSFTFEVAKLNGIPEDLIDKAKDKVSDHKIKIDELTVSLQKEKSKLKKVNNQQYKSTSKAQKLVYEYNKKLNNLQEKAESQARFFEQQNKFVNTGKKIFSFIKKYKHHKTNKMLNEEVNKFIAIEKDKIIKLEKPVVFEENLTPPIVPNTSTHITETKKVEKELKVQITEPPKETPQKIIEIGDMVKLKGNDTKGEVIEKSGSKITVQIGGFKIKTNISEIE